MTSGQNMATITASLQNCSLSNHQRGGTSNSTGITPLDGDGFSDYSENHTNITNTNNNNPSNDATLELNSEVSLPYHWEQCLDLKTGEIYYINWKTGMRVNEDPRTNVGNQEDNLYYSEEEEEDDDDEEDDNYYDSEGSSSAEESSISSSRVQIPQINILTSESARRAAPASAATAPVLVLGGCKRCMMYFMVPKEVDDCPRCAGKLLQFDN